jgi:hypothetical protein
MKELRTGGEALSSQPKANDRPSGATTTHTEDEIEPCSAVGGARTIAGLMVNVAPARQAHPESAGPARSWWDVAVPASTGDERARH